MMESTHEERQMGKERLPSLLVMDVSQARCY